MKFAVDENFFPHLAPILEKILPSHTFTSVAELDRTGEPDVKLILWLGVQGFDAIITHDYQQLEVIEEVSALIISRMHWIGQKEKKTESSITKAANVALAELIMGLPHVLSEWEIQPHAYKLTGIENETPQRVRKELLEKYYVCLLRRNQVRTRREIGRSSSSGSF